MTLDTYSNMLCKSTSSNYKTQHAIGCGQIHLRVYGRQLSLKCSAGVPRELHDQFITAHNGKPLWPYKVFVRTVQEVRHPDVISSGSFADEFRDKHPQEWTNLALVILEEAMET